MKVDKIGRWAGVLCAIVFACALGVGCGPPPRPHGGSQRAEGDRPSREEKRRGKCIIKLMCIDAAKEQWALVHKKQDGDEIVKHEVDEYIRGGGPRCPSGGTYTYGKIGEPPKCSIPGHLLEDWK